MRNKKLMIILILFLITSFFIFYTWNLFQKPNIEEINSCNLDTDCVMVYSDICGGALAINIDYMVSWNQYLDRLKMIYKDVICKPSLSPDLFDAKCISNKCERIIRVPNLE